MKTRKSGVLLHITSLPSPYGIGDFGREAYTFADFLAASGQSVWQILPLNPTSVSSGNSPYCTHSAFAGNPLLISPDLLVQEGFLQASDLEDRPPFENHRVDYEKASEYKYRLLRRAHERFLKRNEPDYEFDRYCRLNADWLDDYSLFTSLKEKFQGAAWHDWPVELRDREEPSLDEWKQKLRNEICATKFYQFLFDRQWSALKSHCNRKNIQVMGDIPIYVDLDSCDVWSHPEIFKLDENKKPLSLAGVPPDYFSSTGQLWGNPVYNWDALAKSRYAWWVGRMQNNLRLFDIVRLDHFRGFVAYWEVPAAEKTAMNGQWVKAPVRSFFDVLLRRFPFLPIVAEDLGTITPDVREIMLSYELAGMKLLLFAFGDDLADNPYVPHNHTSNSVVYTGTHDNNTVRGWFRKEAREEDKQRLFKYLGRTVEEQNVHRELIRLAMMSVAATAIIPMQDILGLTEEARMNVPAVERGNWEWRLTEDLLTEEVESKWLEWTRVYGRF